MFKLRCITVMTFLFLCFGTSSFALENEQINNKTNIQSEFDKAEKDLQYVKEHPNEKALKDMKENAQFIKKTMQQKGISPTSQNTIITPNSVQPPPPGGGGAPVTKGDILFTPDNAISSFHYGHAGIVLWDPYLTMESYDTNGVQYHNFSEWRYRHYYAMYVKGASNSTYTKAQDVAQSHRYKPYNSNFFDKTRTDKFYCSQLVWRAWKDQGYDLDGDGGSIVFPVDLYNSSKTVVYYKQ